MNKKEGGTRRKSLVVEREETKEVCGSEVTVEEIFTVFYYHARQLMVTHAR